MANGKKSYTICVSCHPPFNRKIFSVLNSFITERIHPNMHFFAPEEVN
jgi:hypothetical protein